MTKTQLVTDLTGSITQDELNLLSKGPKFSIQTGINDYNLTDLSIGFYRLANQIRWQQVRSDTPNQQLFMYPERKHIRKTRMQSSLDKHSKKITSRILTHYIYHQT